MNASLHFIGRIRTPYRSLDECPANVDPDGPPCEVIVDEVFAPGIEGLVAGQQVLLLYWLGEADRQALRKKRRGSGEVRGVFALRSPHRPNPIGAAVVRIESLAENRLKVRGMDCLDGTPLLDIKPASRRERAPSA